MKEHFTRAYEISPSDPYTVLLDPPTNKLRLVVQVNVTGGPLDDDVNDPPYLVVGGALIGPNGASWSADAAYEGVITKLDNQYYVKVLDAVDARFDHLSVNMSGLTATDPNTEVKITLWVTYY